MPRARTKQSAANVPAEDIKGDDDQSGSSGDDDAADDVLEGDEGGSTNKGRNEE